MIVRSSIRVYGGGEGVGSSLGGRVDRMAAAIRLAMIKTKRMICNHCGAISVPPKNNRENKASTALKKAARLCFSCQEMIEKIKKPMAVKPKMKSSVIVKIVIVIANIFCYPYYKIKILIRSCSVLISDPINAFIVNQIRNV